MHLHFPAGHWTRQEDQAHCRQLELPLQLRLGEQAQLPARLQRQAAHHSKPLTAGQARAQALLQVLAPPAQVLRPAKAKARARAARLQACRRNCGRKRLQKPPLPQPARGLVRL